MPIVIVEIFVDHNRLQLCRYEVENFDTLLCTYANFQWNFFTVQDDYATHMDGIYHLLTLDCQI